MPDGVRGGVRARCSASCALGNSYEVNLTYREHARSRRRPGRRRTCGCARLNPAPYSGYLQHHGVHLLSSSPERYATVDRHRVLEAKPIKGTTPRGADPERGRRRWRARLATDPKFRAENLMIVDLLRNDLSRCASRARVRCRR